MEPSLKTLDRIIRARPPTVLRPYAFFIAWSGVPTLAYRGFPPPLLDIKNDLDAHVPDLAEENPGSRWPKTTLGALRDGHALQWSDALALRDLCDELNAMLSKQNGRLDVNALAVVRSECKSLERRRSAHRIPLAASTPVVHTPPARHRRRVDRVLRQFNRSNLRHYWNAHLQDGHRLSDYRDDHVEATLIFDLPQSPPLIDVFIRRVEDVLPNAYGWFDSASRHVTLRTLQRSSVRS